MKEKFKKTDFRVYGGLKTNISRIADKIKENGGDMFRVYDMVRATIVCQNIKNLRKAYEKLKA